MAKAKKKAGAKGKAARKRTLSVKKRRVKDLDASRASAAKGGALALGMVKIDGSMVKSPDLRSHIKL